MRLSAFLSGDLLSPPANVDMDVYQVTFAILVLGTGYVAYRHHRREFWPRETPDEESELQFKSLEAEASAARFKRTFIPVYLLVMGSDWLQVCDPAFIAEK